MGLKPKLVNDHLAASHVWQPLFSLKTPLYNNNLLSFYSLMQVNHWNCRLASQNWLIHFYMYVCMLHFPWPLCGLNKPSVVSIVQCNVVCRHYCITVLQSQLKAWESHETVIDFLVNTHGTITCTAVLRVWHLSAFHCNYNYLCINIYISIVSPPTIPELSNPSGLTCFM